MTFGIYHHDTLVAVFDNGRELGEFLDHWIGIEYKGIQILVRSTREELPGWDAT